MRKLYLESAVGNEPDLMGLYTMAPTLIGGVQKVKDRSSAGRDALIVGTPTTLLPTTTASLTYTRLGNRAGGGAPAGGSPSCDCGAWPRPMPRSLPMRGVWCRATSPVCSPTFR